MGLAAEQQFGFQGGTTVNSEKVYLKTHLEASLWSDDFLGRRSIDGSFGENLVLATITI